MILSDREGRFALRRGLVQITPEPVAEAWSSTAVDLRLASALIRWKSVKEITAMGLEPRFRPGRPGFQFSQIVQQFTEQITIPETGYDLAPHQFILGWTLETIRLPTLSRLAARVEGKSSIGRLGLGIHVTAPTIHAGFGEGRPEGIPLQLEIWHTGSLPIELCAGMPICQLIFEEVHGTPERGYAGQFRQQGPAGA